MLGDGLSVRRDGHQSVGARALSGTDQDVLDYLRTRWKEASHHDIRQRVVELSTQSPYTSVRTAATEILSGTPAQIEAFYTDGQYEAGLDDMKVDVARLTNTGGPGVAEAAKAALRNGSALALAKFLKIGQYGEHITDKRDTAARLTNTGGPEVVAAATFLGVLAVAEVGLGVADIAGPVHLVELGEGQIRAVGGHGGNAGGVAAAVPGHRPPSRSCRVISLTPARTPAAARRRSRAMASAPKTRATRVRMIRSPASWVVTDVAPLL
ncbi:ALF repeat-containing protein [Streptomyces anulatus]